MTHHPGVYMPLRALFLAGDQNVCVLFLNIQTSRKHCVVYHNFAKIPYTLIEI